MMPQSMRDDLQCLYMLKKPKMIKSLFFDFIATTITLNYHIIVCKANQSMSQLMNLINFRNNLSLTFLQTSFISHTSNLFIEQVPFQPKPGRLRKKKIYNPLISKGKWTPREQQTYIEFLQTHSDLMETSLQRKSKKVFLMMSQVIQTRDADQCRSHHQKMILYRSSIADIIKYYRNDPLQMELGQSRNLKESQKTLGRTQDTNSCKDDIYQPYKVIVDGSNFHISIQTSKMQTYDLCWSG